MPNEIRNRPLSPHLGIYRPQISSVLSITHRLTGVALYAGSLLLAAWLWSAAYDAPFYQKLHHFLLSPLGTFMLLGWLFSFFFHFANGLRHLWWDTGHGLTLPEVNQSGWTVVLFTLFLTGATWWLASQPFWGTGNLHGAETASE